MGALLITSQKPRLPKELTYPAHAAELEAALAPHAPADSFLWIVFDRQQAHAKKERERIDRKGVYALLRCDYVPDRSHLVDLPGLGRPWHERPDAPVLQAWVHALPRAVIPSPSIPLQVTVRAALSAAITALVPGGLLSNRWHVDVRFDALSSRVIVATTRWVGRRRGVPEEILWT